MDEISVHHIKYRLPKLFPSKIDCSICYRVEREVPLANNKRETPRVLLCKAFEKCTKRRRTYNVLQEKDDKNPGKVRKEFEHH